jgi:ATP-dependent DNA helicase RecQ
VARCKEKFGMNHIIDILRGSKNQKVLQYSHHKLSTYGIGKDKTVEEWRLLGRSLLHQGLLDQTTDGYSVLKLNAASWEVMRRQRPVSIAIDNTPTLSAQPLEARTAEVEMLFQKLRSLRKEIADEQSVPPYVIFADSTLKLMALQQPQTLTEFAKLSGVTSHKMAQYGKKFLTEILAYTQTQNLHPTETEQFTLQLYQQGLSVAEIAQKRDLRPTTIIRHLSDMVEKNQDVDLDRLVDRKRQVKIYQVLEKLGDISLTPIREYLGEDYSYDEIRLVRGRWRHEKQM